MSFKPYTEKIKKKKIENLFDFRSDPDPDPGPVLDPVHHPGSGSADPDPDQNYTDPKHWL